ncbi:type II secretion system F family protein [Caulobacter sp. CCNWLY153]|uniref:type II secretion system F family protein n=1 Tax=unclassified Caulobacter TaxID=2648921 RepID=UPI002FF120EC
MPSFAYRAATPSGQLRAGVMESPSRDEVLASLRQQGLMPIEAQPQARAREGRVSLNGQARAAMINILGELAVLLGAGLALDRALAVCIENAPDPALKAATGELLKRVKEGAPLSKAMAEAKGLFPPMAVAMAESGEANGKLDEALARLALTLERAEALRRTVASAMVYPALLSFVAAAVILMMLLFVVPQFEGLFSERIDQLPPATRMVLGASHGVRQYGLHGLAALIVLGILAWRQLKQPSTRRILDRNLLALPRLGDLIKAAETARLARVLGSLVGGGVPLPQALGIAQRSLTNSHMAAAIAKVTNGLKEGGGLARPLAAAGVLPPLAASFLRTGEETAQLPLMLERLADVLDRDVRIALERLLALLTPLITIVLGTAVAGIIASVMSAILGFNDLALSR